jgi:hypothetical protein
MLTVVLAPTLLWAIFLFEASLAKLKSQEASRYLVWEMTAAGLSDWRGGHHEARFSEVKTEVIQEVQDRWGDDLESATPDFTHGARAGPPITLEVGVDPDQLGLQEVDAGAWDTRLAGMDFHALGQTLESMLAHFNFNLKGAAKGEFALKISNRYSRAMGFSSSQPRGSDAGRLTLKSTQSLIADTWDLKDGRAVVEIERVNCFPDNPAAAGSDYCRQVARMAFLGLADKMPGLDSMQTWLSAAKVHGPLAASVASLPMTGYPDAASHALEVARPPDHNTVSLAHTNVWNDRNPLGRGGFANSKYNQVYQKLGPHYMGCPEEQQEQCSYGSR